MRAAASDGSSRTALSISEDLPRRRPPRRGVLSWYAPGRLDRREMDTSFGGSMVEVAGIEPA
jgi:hypothetical protein